MRVTEVSPYISKQTGSKLQGTTLSLLPYFWRCESTTTFSSSSFRFLPFIIWINTADNFSKKKKRHAFQGFGLEISERRACEEECKAEWNNIYSTTPLLGWSLVSWIFGEKKENGMCPCWPFNVLKKSALLVFLEVRCFGGSWADWWLFQVDWYISRSHSIIVDQSSIRERAIEVYQAFVMNSWDTWWWKG